MRRSHEALQKIVAAAARYIAAGQTLRRIADTHRHNVSATRTTIESGMIPGLPLIDETLTLTPEEQRVLLGTGIRPGGSIMIDRQLLDSLSVAGYGVTAETYIGETTDEAAE